LVIVAVMPLVPGPALLLAGLALLLVACGGQSPLGGFEDDLDTGDAPTPDLPQSECDPRRDNQCDEGLKCSFVVDPEYGPLNRCVPVIGGGLAGEPCWRSETSDSCASHHICWAVDGEGQGVCVEFCSLALKCLDPVMTCSVSNGDLLSLCLPKCDPLLQDCAEGWACYPDDFDRWACDRDQSGLDGEHGDPCACINCCDPGLVCTNGGLVDDPRCGFGGAPSCCTDVCALEDGMPVEGICSSEAERCESFYDDGVVLMGYDHVGLCRL
jgi:hypothetical protein